MYLPNGPTPLMGGKGWALNLQNVGDQSSDPQRSAEQVNANK